MNRFILVILALSMIFGLPYLLWVLQDGPELEIDAATKEKLQNEDGINWMLKHLQVSESADSHMKLEFLSGDVTKEEWNQAIEETTKNKIILARGIEWRSQQDEALTKEMQDYSGASPTGWIVRYFEDLSRENEEIPEWAFQANGGTWNYTGSGFILSNEQQEKFAVIESEEKLTTSESNASYSGWVEVVKPTLEDEVMEWFTFPVTIPEELKEAGMLPQFPAFIQRNHKNTSMMYMTGNLSALQSPPSLYQVYGLTNVYELFYASRTDGFYWTTFTDQFSTFVKETDFTDTIHDVKNAELVHHFRVNESKFEYRVNDSWKELTIKGVNIGMAKPGYFPGEAAITETEYYRWFEQIGELNANAVRVYTVHPPGFYRALKQYNEAHDEKIYLFHGVWADEERMAETLDAYDEEVLEKFEQEYKDIIDLLHGNKRILPKVGHASGIYDADVSDYVIGWVIGIEWYPYFVQGTNEKYETNTQFAGTYYQVEEGSPFEVWLAEQMEGITSYEVEKYNEMRPMSFTNWVTTDLLEHPSEPDEKEDLVGVDPNVIATVGDMADVRQFASYHIYPYYPDFFNVDVGYNNFKDHRGENNSYAAYLKELIEAHNMPVLVAEFGIPASRGMTHQNPYGWNQGFMSEQAQGEVVASLYEDILQAGYAGGLIFTWQDEWFKRTWNTMDYDDPDRRPYWSNAQTNEQQFGLLSFDRHLVKVDGDLSEWNEENLFGKADGLKFYVNSDERYLYLAVNGVDASDKVQMVIDTLPNEGITSLTPHSQLQVSDPIEFYGKIQGDEGQLLIDATYDYYHYLYADLLGLIEPVEKNSPMFGAFTPIYYALNKEIYYPELNETRPFEYYETGKLQRGNGNPDASDYDSLTDYAYGEGTLEIRLPWLLLQVKDPSQREVMGNLQQDGAEASEIIESFGIGLIVESDESQVTIPETKDGKMTTLPRYTWDTWQLPKSEERLKQSYYILQEVFAEVD